MTHNPVYHDGKVHVLNDKCATCVFRNGNLMHLDPGRLAGMVKDSIAGDAAITCHSTLYGESEQEAVCRGFFDKHADDVVTLRLAQALDVITYIDPPTKETT